MTTVVGKSRNPIVQQAFAGLRAEQRADGKKKPEPVEVEPVKKAARKKGGRK